MKANELMVGDLLKCRESTCQGHRVDYINEMDGEVGVDGEILDLDMVHPIPLTPEILEKNEFVTVNGEFVFDFYNGTVVIYNRFDYNLRIVENYKTILDIRYYCEIAVHELQHALRLCKILKEIVL